MNAQLTPAEARMLQFAEQLRQELADPRLHDSDGRPFRTITAPAPHVEFVDQEQKRRALLELAPGTRWLMQFFDGSGSLLGTRSGALPEEIKSGLVRSVSRANLGMGW
jgi:hypothetical protein